MGKDYFRFWSAGLAANLGDGIALVVYPWLASMLTKDPFLIGSTLALWRAPWLLFSLPMGALLDRVNRYDVIAAANAARTVLTVAFAVCFQLGLMNLAVFFTGVFLLGSCSVLHQLAAETIVPALVDSRQLEQAYGRLWSIELLAGQFVGPLIAGTLVGSLVFVPLSANAVATAVAVLLLFLVSDRSTPVAAPADSRAARGLRHTGHRIGEAVAYLWSNRTLRVLALTLAALNPVIMMVQATFILYIQEVLGGGSLMYGAILAAGGLGGVAGGVLAARILRRVSTGAVLCSFFYIAPIVNAGMALVPAPVVVGALNCVLSFTVVVWNVVGRSSRQRIMSDNMRGRVTSVIRWFGWGLIPLGFLAGGAVAKALEPTLGREGSLRAPMLIGAVLFLVIGLFAAPHLTTKRMSSTG